MRRGGSRGPAAGGGTPGSLGSRRSIVLLVGAGTAELILLTTLGWWPGHGMPHPGLLLFGGAFGAYAVGALAVGRHPRDHRAAWTAVWGLGLAMRLTLIPLTPELSDDFWRYLWDGHVQLSGLNPYLFAPGDAALDGLSTPWRGLINNPGVPTIYPPVAQLAFLAVAAVGGTLVQLKLLWLAFDMATGWLLLKVARATGRSGRRVLLLYLWSPLLVVEVAWNAHLEPLGLAGLAALLTFTGPARLPDGQPGRRAVGAGVALAWASLTKFAPAAALPALLRRGGRPLLWGLMGASLLLYLPYARAGGALFRGLGTYARHWRFNETGFALLEALLPGPLVPRLAAAVMVLAVVGWVTLRRFDAGRSLLWILGTGLFLSPTLHPWYALWILPLAALRESPGWILFTGTVFVGYLGLGTYADTGLWPQPLWARLLIWVPVGVTLLLGRSRRPARPEPRPSP